MYPKSDYDLLYANLMNAVDATNERLGAPDSDTDRNIHNTASLFRKAIGTELDPSDTIRAATLAALPTAQGRLEWVVLILLQDRLFAVWDIGKLLPKAHVVVTRYADVRDAVVAWGEAGGPWEGAVTLTIDGGEDLTVGLVTDDPAKAQFLREIVVGDA